MGNQVVWFDLPVLDLDRAMKFYSDVLGAELNKDEHDGFTFAVLPHEKPFNGGCLVPNQENPPSRNGVMIYLNVDNRIDEAITAVTQNGGEILQDKHQIGPFGYRAIIVDTEGNRVALHAENN
ncbi:MAG: VOC family protein [Gammaproteobacteria bacterium]